MNNYKNIDERGLLTRERLEQALNRVVDGVPERTPNDGGLSLSRINKEAGLSAGGIDYYKDFVVKARDIIDRQKFESATDLVASGKASVDKMRAQRDKERELKERYRSQRDDIKAFCDKIIAKNAQLEFSLFEALDKIEDLESEVSAFKIVDIGSRRSQ